MSAQTSLIYVAVGLILIISAATVLSPAEDQEFYPWVVDQSDTIADFDVQYSELPQSAQTIVDSAIAGEDPIISTYEDYEAVQSLRGSKDIQKGDTVYMIRTETADNGGLFEAILRASLLSAGGLLFALSYIQQRKATTLYNLALLPAVAATVLLGVEIYQAPMISLVHIEGYLAFGLASSIPVLLGMWIKSRQYLILGLIMGIVALSVISVLADPGTSDLYILAPLIVLGIPGLGLGWLVENSLNGRGHSPTID
ncbi:hypothetical protein SVXHr_2464 [Halorhabdus sp. SVX81]|uniref:hypothetical protein n=1 Tax=Halorhabdus sp. SVX81 TaxID=2978283 RepID=UPI0023DB111E|nr:hypothetical protein [Halorhabdus sp. SVX81]WEL18614.1 hypothetical protein SVXHr_2464 [Halorhabdus sp. SVX81]